ncbi:MAG: hypothetical protein V3V74_07305 [Nitrosomonadaceae bacterium]
MGKAITVKMLGQTSTKPTRLKVSDLDGNGFTQSWNKAETIGSEKYHLDDNKYSNGEYAAYDSMVKQFLEQMGWKWRGFVGGWTDNNTMVFVERADQDYLYNELEQYILETEYNTMTRNEALKALKAFYKGENQWIKN